jgi:hypothetical protein
MSKRTTSLLWRLRSWWIRHYHFQYDLPSTAGTLCRLDYSWNFDEGTRNHSGWVTGRVTLGDSASALSDQVPISCSSKLRPYGVV